MVACQTPCFRLPLCYLRVVKATAGRATQRSLPSASHRAWKRAHLYANSYRCGTPGIPSI
jgi:hypothetical protein